MLHVVQVSVQVRPECVDAFKEVTLANAAESLREPGVVRFDILQRKDDPCRFMLVEAYRSLDAPMAHKETSHYQAWRDTVADMMAMPRQSVVYRNVWPSDERWVTVPEA